MSENGPRQVVRRRRFKRINERGADLQQNAYPEERRNYAKLLLEMGFKGNIRKGVALAVLVKIITEAYIAGMK